jgi:hypothetical protein
MFNQHDTFKRNTVKWRGCVMNKKHNFNYNINLWLFYCE